MTELSGGLSWQGGWDEPGVLSVVLIESSVSGSGLFVYSGTPAAGNLVESIVASAGTDPFGNVTVAGVASYAATFATAINGGQVTWYAGSLSTSWTSVATATSHAVSPQGLVIQAAAEINLVNSAGSSGLVLGTAVGPNVVSLSGAVGAITAGVPGAANTIESWHSMSLLNSWANVAGYAVAQYRAVASPPNSIEIIGAINAAAATSGIFFTLPAHYIPADQQPVCGLGVTASVGAGLVSWVQCDASGNLSVQNTGGVPGAWHGFFHGFISLDA